MHFHRDIQDFSHFMVIFFLKDFGNFKQKIQLLLFGAIWMEQSFNIHRSDDIMRFGFLDLEKCWRQVNIDNFTILNRKS